MSTTRSFTVAPAPGAPAPGAPPPGTVQGGPGALKATSVKVHTPKPHRAALPAKVTGKVGALTGKFTVTAKLKGAKVVLQARARSGAGHWAG